MSRVLSAQAEGSAGEAARVLGAGGVVVIPTDTVYGVAARLDRPEALRRIFHLKRRSSDKPLPVLAASIEAARAVARFDAEAEAAAFSGWPGPLTLVVARAPGFQAYLGGAPEHAGTVGVRVPDHGFALELLGLAGPLAATSANVSGESVPSEIHEIAELFGDGVDLYVDGGRCDARPSKIVSFVAGGEILRARPVEN